MKIPYRQIIVFDAVLMLLVAIAGQKQVSTQTLAIVIGVMALLGFVAFAAMTRHRAVRNWRRLHDFCGVRLRPAGQ